MVHGRGTGRRLGFAPRPSPPDAARTARLRRDATPPADTADVLLATLERDLPALRADMDAFFERFEDRACAVLAVEDSPQVQGRLQELLRDAGIA